MTTATQAKRYARQHSNNQIMLVLHTPGHVDNRGIDRGYSVLTCDEAENLAGATIVLRYLNGVRVFN